MQTGMILLWSGAIVDIPAGFALCDGSNGTPNLKNQFVVGAGDTYAVDANGGALTHTHPFTATLHAHYLEAGTMVNSGVGYENYTNEHAVTGTTDATNHLPPYYALAYIMKL